MKVTSTARTLQCAAELGRASDAPEFTRALLRAVWELEASHYVAVAFDTDEHSSGTPVAHNLPPQYLSACGDAGPTSLDPVMEHCRTTSLPIVWDASTYIQGGANDLWDSMEPFGVTQGIALALHLTKHRHFFLEIQWSRTTPLTVEERRGAIRVLQTMAVYAEPCAYRIAHSERRLPAPADSVLTNDELTCLEALGRGLSDDTIGHVMKQPSARVTIHIERAMRKLGAINRVEAAVAIHRLGLLSRHATDATITPSIALL